MSTINKEEIQKFSRLAEEWWDVNGKFKPLHMFNPIRIEYITESIKNHFKIKWLIHLFFENKFYCMVRYIEHTIFEYIRILTEK